MSRYEGFAILAGCLAGTTGMIGRILAAGGMSTTEIGACRFAVAALLYLAAVLYENPKSLKIRVRDIWIFLGTGVVGQLMYSFLYFSAIELTPLAVASTLSLIWPFLVIFLARIFFREPLTAKKLLAAAAAFAGCAVSSGALSGARPSLTGVVLALGAGLSYSLYSIFSRVAMQRGYPPKVVSFYTWLFAAVGNRLIWLEEKPFVRMFSSWQNAAACLFIGVAVGYVGNLLYLKALERIDAGKASVLTFTTPIVAAILGVVCYLEPVTLEQIVGIVLILSGLIILNLRGGAEKTPEC